MPRDGSGQYHAPPGTDGAPDTTIDSTRYNLFIADLEQVLNTPAPIIGGGTGGGTPDEALDNLGAEKKLQVVTNYDSMLWESGSFLSASTATNPPIPGHAFSGVVYVIDANNITVEARDQDGTTRPGALYIRQKKAGVWSAWVTETSGGGGPAGPPGAAGGTFPDAPNDGALYGRKAATPGGTMGWAVASGGGGASVLVSDTPPVAADNSLWWESDTGLLYIRYNDGNSTQWVLAAPGMSAAAISAVTYTPQTLTAAQQTQARQNIYAAPFDALAYSGMQINGNMEVSQEFGAAAPVALTTMSLYKYIIDGWGMAFANTSAVMRGQQSPSGPMPNGSYFPYVLNMTAPTAMSSVGTGDYAQIVHHIEGWRVARLGWGTSGAQPITVSFWIYSVLAGHFSLSATNGATNRTYVADVVISSPLTWEYKTVTIPGDVTGTWAKDNTKGLTLIWTLACGTNYQTAGGVWTATPSPMLATPAQSNLFASANTTVFLTGVVVLPATPEAPSAARSPFIMRPYDEELIACQRYFWKWNGAQFIRLALGYADAATSAQVALPASTMRAVPTVSQSGLSVNGNPVTSVVINGVGANINHLGFNVAGGLTANSAVQVYSVTGPASLQLDARL